MGRGAILPPSLLPLKNEERDRRSPPLLYVLGVEERHVLQLALIPVVQPWNRSGDVHHLRRELLEGRGAVGKKVGQGQVRPPPLGGFAILRNIRLRGNGGHFAPRTQEDELVRGVDINDIRISLEEDAGRGGGVGGVEGVVRRSPPAGEIEVCDRGNLLDALHVGEGRPEVLLLPVFSTLAFVLSRGHSGGIRPVSRGTHTEQHLEALHVHTGNALVSIPASTPLAAPHRLLNAPRPRLHLRRGRLLLSRFSPEVRRWTRHHLQHQAGVRTPSGLGTEFLVCLQVHVDDFGLAALLGLLHLGQDLLRRLLPVVRVEVGDIDAHAPVQHTLPHHPLFELVQAGIRQQIPGVPPRASHGLEDAVEHLEGFGALASVLGSEDGDDVGAVGKDDHLGLTEGAWDVCLRTFPRPPRLLLLPVSLSQLPRLLYPPPHRSDRMRQRIGRLAHVRHGLARVPSFGSRCLVERLRDPTLRVGEGRPDAHHRRGCGVVHLGNILPVLPVGPRLVHGRVSPSVVASSGDAPSAAGRRRCRRRAAGREGRREGECGRGRS
mmetsp:Transcript_15296/g.44410  ORF Transcript_15296/g.44410 Transcript_15296/m.44410 type:complete len:548 (-) Transcript_15296:261-1904(-)